MGVKIQFNPSTGLASYNSSTELVQVAPDVPPTNYITLAGIRKCSDDTLWTAMNDTHAVSSSMDCANIPVFSLIVVEGTTYRVNFTPFGGGVTTLHVFLNAFPFGDVFLANMNPCSDKNTTSPLSNTTNCGAINLGYDGTIIWDFTIQ